MGLSERSELAVGERSELAVGERSELAVGEHSELAGKDLFFDRQRFSVLRKNHHRRGAARE